MARRVSLTDLSGRRRRVRRGLFWGGILLGVLLVAAGLVWGAARTNLFRVQSIEIAGATYIPPEDIRAFLDAHVAQGRVSRLFGADNLLVWPGGFSGDDLRDMPAATAIDIQKNFFRRTITVAVSERERVGIWCFEETIARCFWFDREGILFLPAYSAEGNLTAVLHDYSRPALALGEVALAPRFLPNLLSIFGALRTTDLSVREARLEDLVLEEIEVDTYDGPQLLFSLRFPAAGAPDAIATLKGMAKIADLQYIDFRVENKVYYK